MSQVRTRIEVQKSDPGAYPHGGKESPRLEQSLLRSFLNGEIVDISIGKKVIAFVMALAIGSVAVVMAGTSAFGETVSSATSSAYGVQLAGPVPIGARPEVSASLAAPTATDSFLEVPADPLATSFTASVTADAKKESTLNATLQSVMETASPGLPTKWNSRGHAITEDLNAVTNQILADVIESESVSSCDGGQTTFGSAARIVNLSVAGTAIILPTPTPNAVVFNQLGIKVTLWETNWDPATGGTTDGSSTVFTNGMHVTAPGGIDLIVSHSEAASACAAAQPAEKQCEDGIDNGDPEDSLADEKDPGCHTDGDATNAASYDPKDNDETDEAECADGIDNGDPEDSLADKNDPGCHTDGDPNNASSYDRDDDNEADDGAAPPASAVTGDPTFTG